MTKRKKCLPSVSVPNHYTLGTWLCDYNGSGATACFTPGWSTTSGAGPLEIRIGATMTGLGGAIAGDDDATFNLTVAYE